MLPLKPVFLLILLVLADEERYGYEIVKLIRARTEGLVRLEPGNLYRFVNKLMDLGLVAEGGRKPTTSGGDERRRYYAITPFGRLVVAAEVARMKTLIAAAEQGDLLIDSKA